MSNPFVTTPRTSMSHICRSKSGAALLASLVLTLPAISEAVPVPTITGPVPVTVTPGDPSHNYNFFASNHDLPTNGYIEEEYYISGSASYYDVALNQQTTATVLGSSPFVTRVVVRRPADTTKFNGAVLVEWLNVTNGFDADNLWFFAWEHVLRSGYAWVGVSAQRVGVNALKAWNPTRYGTFNVSRSGISNDDSLCYDIFSQVGEAIRRPGGVDILGGLRPALVIATGESQSANRLATYVNAIDPLVREYDGFLLLSALGTQIRTDLAVPVWKISTEYDVAQTEAYHRQPNTNLFRAWEIAGTSHVDQHLRDSREPLELRDNTAQGLLNGVTTWVPSSAEATLAPQCTYPTLGTRVPQHYVVGTAFDLLVRWAKGGKPPPIAPQIAVTTLNTPPTYSVLTRNSLGLALGGIQLADIAVPTAVNNGVNAGPGACVRWGYYVPFSVDQLDQLYPSHQQYVQQVITVTRQNVRDGYILNDYAQQTIDAATNSSVGKNAR